MEPSATINAPQKSNVERDRIGAEKWPENSIE